MLIVHLYFCNKALSCIPRALFAIPDMGIGHVVDLGAWPVSMSFKVAAHMTLGVSAL